MKSTAWILAFAFGLAFWALIYFCISCGPAHGGSGYQAELFTAPDGAQCYALTNNGVLFGGNCK